MAWSDGARCLNGNSKAANQTSLTISNVINQVNIGNVAVLVVAVDNNQTTDGDEGAVTSVTDSGGNTWTKAAEFCNGQGAAQAGTTCSIWYTLATAAITTSITANFSNSASRDASAAICHSFSMAAGSTVSVQATATLANDGADPGSLNVTTPNAEFLRVRGISGETSSTTDITATSGWGQSTFDQSAGGSAVTNQAARLEYRISTGTGDASDPTWTAVDCASVYVAFKETLAGGGGPPNGWLGQLNRAPAIVALPLAAALTWCPQPIAAPAAAAPSLGWQAPLSVAPPIVNVARTFAFVPWNTAQTPPPALSIAWQSALSVAPPVIQVSRSFSFVPFNTVQPAAVTIALGWQSQFSRAQPLANVPYSQPQLVPLDNPDFYLGWQPPLSSASQVARVPSYSAASFVVPPFVVPSGWQSPLSTASPALARAPASFSFVPFNTAQVQPATPTGWQSALSTAPPIVRPAQNFAYVPFNTAQPVVATVYLGWQPPLSVAPPIVKAAQSFAFVPFNTPQLAAPVTSYGWQSALSVAPQRAVTPSQSFSSVPFAVPPVISIAWQQPLSVAPALGRAPQSYFYVPFNTAQIVIAPVNLSWQSPLSVAPSVTKTQAGFSSVPFGPTQVAAQAVSVAWQQPLSVAAQRQQTSRLFAFVPWNTPQVTPATTQGLGWYSPLSTAPISARFAPYSYSFVPLDTYQLAPEAPPREHHPGRPTVPRPGGFLGRMHISMSIGDDTHSHIGDSTSGFLAEHRNNMGNRTSPSRPRGGLRGFLRKDRS